MSLIKNHFWLKRVLSRAAFAVAALNSSVFAISAANANDRGHMKTVRTYMNYSELIDPAHILTMADLELSVSLSETLVKFDDRRELVSALAERWIPIAENKMQFILKSGLRWSNGEPVKARQYQDALLRAKRVYGKDLKALFDVIQKIEAIDDRTLTITTVGPIRDSGLLSKLTEPMYGLVATEGDKVNVKKTVGSFWVKSVSSDILILTLNKNWYLHQSGMPETIEIKHPPREKDILLGFVDDPWANLVSGSSILNASTLEKFKSQNFRLWQRTDDKLFALYPSKTFVQSGGNEIIKRLADSIKVSNLLEGLSGFTPAQQFFPRGYTLWSKSPPKVAPASSHHVKKIRIIVPESSIASLLQSRLPALIKSSTGFSDASVEVVKLADLNTRMKNQDFDVLATHLAVADPNFEGAVSFFVERDPPFIPSVEKPFDFATQVKAARALPTSDERANRIRDIILRAQEAGFVLPLFHSSSLAVAKGGVDLSGIPNTDETVHFSKVRMK